MGERAAEPAAASTPAPSTPARRPTRRPAPSSRRSRCPRRSPRTASAGTSGFEYSRSGNPTRAALEACVASLESARHGLAFASGLAAEDNVLRLVPAGRPGPARQRRLRRHVPPDRQGVGPARHAVDGGRPHRRRRPRRRLARRHRDGVAGDADQPAADVHRHRGGRRRRPRARRAGRRRQHVRHAVPAAAARRSAPTSSCTRRRSTSAATATSSAASSPSTTTGSPIGCASRRTPPAPCPARSTATSCCAA